MKKVIFLLMIMLATGFTSAESLVNTSFEDDANSDGVPDGWVTYFGGDASIGMPVLITDGTAHSGNNYMRNY